MFDLITNFWYLWLVLLLAMLFKVFKPSIKGWFGEELIALYLRKLPEDEYTVINDVILSTDSGTTQIDHIVISLYGIFIIETKNYKGWIFGGEKSAQWTQNIYGKKSSFLNPLRQNYGHVKAVEARLTQYPKLPIIPIVAFSSTCDLKVKTTSHVVYFHRVYELIRSYSTKAISAEDVSAITALLQTENQTSAQAKKDHVKSVVNKKMEFQNAAAEGKCPKCDGTLVERRGKNGAFIGCSNYPKCRFTRQL